MLILNMKIKNQLQTKAPAARAGAFVYKEEYMKKRSVQISSTRIVTILIMYEGDESVECEPIRPALKDM